MGAASQGQWSGPVSLHDEAKLLAWLSERQSQLVLELLQQAADADAVQAQNEQLASDLADSFDRITEVHHRVRNHLQTVTGLLSAQELMEESPTARQALQKSIGRLASIATIHDLLTRQPLSDEMALPDLMAQLAQHLLRATDAEGRISIAVEAATLRLPAREATAFVLVLTELISNALEHGFPGEARGSISVRLCCDGERATLVVRDSGCGLPPGFDLGNSSSLGLGLASRLVERDLGGVISTLPSSPGSAGRPPGAAFAVTFPVRSGWAAG